MLLLFALIVGSSSVTWGQTTYKLTQVTSVEAGGKYVFEQGGHVMSNSVSSKALQTTNSYNTTGLAGTESYVWTLETADGGFYMKNVSLTSSQYLNNTSSTTVSFGSKNSIWAFNFQTDNTVLIQNKSNDNRYLGYTTSTSYAYKAYATSNMDYSHAINVYKLEVESGGETPTITAPTLSEANNAQLAYGTNVTITNYNNNYVYFYTIDGSTPDCDADLHPIGTSSIYSKGITINSDVTVKVIAADIEGNKSSVTTATYTVIRPTAPILSPAAGIVLVNTVVTISNKDDDYMYFYTDDNSVPTVSNLTATGTTKAFPDNGVNITEATTLKVIAVDENGLLSDVVTAAYTIGTPAQTTIDLRGVTTGLEFSPGDFTSSGSGYQSYEDVTYTGSNQIDYSGWKLDYVMKSNGNLQLKASTGKVTMPTILTDNGFTITVTATTNSVIVSDGSDSNTNELEVSSSSADITIKAGSAYAVISKITITPVVVSNVATPVITLAGGTYTETKTTTITCETEGAAIYYTLDGTEPDANSTAYTLGTSIAINESCTLKAIAIKDNESSAVASAIYVINLPLTTIAQVKALDSGDTFNLDLTGAQIVFFDGSKNLFIRDNTGAILFYSEATNGFSTTLTTGDILSGVVSGTYSPYKNLPEVKNCDITNLTKTSNETVVAKVIEGTTEAVAANLCDLVKIENTEITESSSKYYVGVNSDIQLYDQFDVGYTVTTEEPVDVSGIATVYNTTYELFPRYETDIVYLDNSEEVSVPAKGYITFCSEKALDFTSTDAITVYTAKVVGGKVVMTQIKKVPAETGVILMNASGLGSAVEATNVPFLSEDADDVSDNELVGVLENTLLDYSVGGKFNYVLQQQNGDAEPHFYKAVNGTLRAKRAYLSTTYDVNSAGAPALSIDWGEGTTGINSVERGALSVEGCYTLDGRRVAQPTKGLYIVNGRKVIIK